MLSDIMPASSSVTEKCRAELHLYMPPSGHGPVIRMRTVPASQIGKGSAQPGGIGQSQVSGLHESPSSAVSHVTPESSSPHDHTNKHASMRPKLRSAHVTGATPGTRRPSLREWLARP